MGGTPCCRASQFSATWAAERACARPIDAGIALVDTAEVYGFGGSERAIGEIVRQPGGGAFTATKFAPSLAPRMPLRVSRQRPCKGVRVR